MRIKNTVFGSNEEKGLYDHLVSKWSSAFRIYPQLPFTFIIEEFENGTLSPREIGFLYSTSVDYTVCNRKEKPLLSIEFDGMGDGFSSHGEYRQERPVARDQYRKLKFDLKLRVCNEVEYPFFIVGLEEKQDIGKEMYLTIVDGIIGQVLATKYYLQTNRPRIDGMIEKKESFLSALSPEAAAGYIADLHTTAQLDADRKFDPIVKKAEELWIRAYEQGMHISSSEALTEPEFALEGMETQEEFDKSVKEIKRVGCKVTVKTSKIPVIQTVWVRNFDDYYVVPFKLARNIAELLAFKRALDLSE